MKAIIYVRSNKEILKPIFKSKCKEDTVTLYRTDSFGSISLNREYAKVYGVRKHNNEVIVNECKCTKKRFKSLYVNEQVSILKDMFKDINRRNYYLSYVGKTFIGYELFEDEDVDKYSIREDAIPVSSVDMFIINCHSDGTIVVTNAIVENRNKNIELILK